MLLVSPIYYSLLIVDHEEGSRLAKRLKVSQCEIWTQVISYY